MIKVVRVSRFSLTSAVWRVFVFSAVMCVAEAGLAQENDASRQLDAAIKTMRLTSGYHLDVTISANGGTSHVVGDVAGDDFSLVVNDTTAVRRVGANAWASEDGGQHWHTAQADTVIYGLVISPLGGSRLPPGTHFEVVDQGSEGDHGFTVVELKADSKEPYDTFKFRIAQSAERSWVERFSGPTIFMGTVVSMDARYSNVDGVSKIDVPQ